MGMTQTERDVRSNKPFTLFEIDGKPYKVQVLSINAADDWLEKAHAVSDLDGAVQSASNAEERKKARKEWSEALYACVFAYAPDVLPHGDDEDAIDDKVSPEQMVDAFWRLRDRTDPFGQMNARTMDRVNAQLASLPSGAVERAMQHIPIHSD